MSLDAHFLIIIRRNACNPFRSIKQQITNLIKYGVATGVNLAYNTTNTPNKFSSHQFINNIKGCYTVLNIIYSIIHKTLYSIICKLYLYNSVFIHV